MRRIVASGLILAFAVVAVILTAPSADAVSTAVATDGDIYTGAASFSSDRKIKASNSPILRTAISIPPEIVQGVVFQVDCVVEAIKNAKGAPKPGVTGSIAAFFITLDVGSLTWSFVGLVGQGTPFTTQKDGTSSTTTGPITAGPWADAHDGNDQFSIAATFTNTKKVQATSFRCEIVVGG